jgi:hypothetical protein
MDIKSKDLKADEAIKLMDAVTLEELGAFIEGDERKTVINAAEERRKALTSPPDDGVKGPVTEGAGQGLKQGEVRKITTTAGDSGLKEGPVRKEAARKILTIRDSAPCWVGFDEKGKQIWVERA